ncbi:MAG: periplasmic heavy metal sensor [Bacteroidota bacterium]
MKHIMFFPVALLMFIAAPLTLTAQGHGRGPGLQDRGQRIHERLNLTDAQSKDFDKLRIERQKQQIDFRAQHSKARLELREIFRSDNPDRKVVDQKLAEISRLDDQRRKALADHWFAMQKILTPEQQKIWRESAPLLGGEFHSGMRGRGMDRPRMQRQRGWE